MGFPPFNSNRKFPLTTSLMSLLYKTGQEEDILPKWLRSVSSDSYSVSSSDLFIVDSDSEKKEGIDNPPYRATISNERLFLYRTEQYLIRRLKKIGEEPWDYTKPLQGSSESKKLNELLRIVGKAKKMEQRLFGSKQEFEDRSKENSWLQKELDDSISSLLKCAKEHRNFCSLIFFSKPESYQVLDGFHSDCGLKSTVLNRESSKLSINT